MKYILVNWPDIQDYMGHPDYDKDCYHDPDKDVWFIPEEWEDLCPNEDYDAFGIGPDIGDLDDAMG